eukprot:3698169-Amphidinium_carterae.1
MAVAFAVASSGTRLASASEELRSTFVAKSTGSAVQSLARTIAGQGPIYPLSEQVAIGVAASLKTAGFRSAPMALYLDELRLGHIEAGWQ